VALIVIAATWLNTGSPWHAVPGSAVVVLALMLAGCLGAAILRRPQRPAGDASKELRLLGPVLSRLARALLRAIPPSKELRLLGPVLWAAAGAGVGVVGGTLHGLDSGTDGAIFGAVFGALLGATGGVVRSVGSNLDKALRRTLLAAFLGAMLGTLGGAMAGSVFGGKPGAEVIFAGAVWGAVAGVTGWRIATWATVPGEG
jgi:hypothetical protein